MFDIAILGQVALGYSPFIDRNREVVATRLTVFPLKPDATLDVAQLLHAVGGVWPANGGRVSLNVTSESLLVDLLAAQPTANVMIEIPAFLAGDARNVESIRSLHAAGNQLLLKGRPSAELPRDVLPCFTHSLIDYGDDRRIGETAPPPGVKRTIPHVQAGIRTVAQMQESFDRGATSVLGWPIDDVIATGGKLKAGQTALQVIVELIHRVDREESIERIEQTLKLDPTLAFKLLRYINSPAFGLRVEIASFRHAIMMLGYKRLRRWLALLLATASKDVNLKPVMFAAVRRGMLMEELVRAGGDEEMRAEMFICGVFSLLDRMFQQPFAELLGSIPVPARVYQCLAEDTGPFAPYMNLVRAIENESLFDLRDAADTLMMSVAEVNRAELRALSSARDVESG